MSLVPYSKWGVSYRCNGCGAILSHRVSSDRNREISVAGHIATDCLQKLHERLSKLENAALSKARGE